MERLKTRIWRGGMEEILANANKTALPTSSPFAVTRILSAEEASEVHRVVHSHVHASLERPSALPDAKQSSDAQVRELAQELGLGPRRKRRAGWALFVVTICVGAWFAQRAAATSKVKSTPPALQTRALPTTIAVPVPTVEPLVRSWREPPHTAAPLRPRQARPRGLPRAAVDALAAGDDSGAAALYRQLAEHEGESAAFIVAADILSVRTAPRHTRVR